MQESKQARLKYTQKKYTQKKMERGQAGKMQECKRIRKEEANKHIERLHAKKDE